MIISLIAAIGKNNAIGVGGKLPWNLPANRQNIVITRDKNYKAEGIEIVHSLEEALALFPRGTLGNDEEIFVIGGSEIYRAALPHANRLYITEVDASPAGDAFFPEWNRNEWKEVAREAYEPDEKNSLSYVFIEYERII